MKKLYIPLLLISLCSCARFNTTQTDYSYDPETGNKIRQITTKAASSTFFESKSSLTTWKATQTDKTQGATVGGLEQSSTGTNTVSLLKALADLVGALPK